MRRTIYESIKEKLKEISDIKHVALWNNQVAFIEMEQLFEMPAVFIEFQQIEWKSISSEHQSTDATINLHIVSEFNSDEDTLKAFDLCEKIKKAIHNEKLGGASPLRRIGSTSEHNHEQLLENVETYIAKIIEG